MPLSENEEIYNLFCSTLVEVLLLLMCELYTVLCNEIKTLEFFYWDWGRLTKWSNTAQIMRGTILNLLLPGCETQHLINTSWLEGGGGLYINSLDAYIL